MLVKITINGTKTLVDYETADGATGTSFGFRRILAAIGCRTDDGDVIEMTVTKAKRTVGAPVGPKRCGSICGANICTRIMRHRGDHEDEWNKFVWKRGVVPGGLRPTEAAKVSKARAR